MQETGKNSFVLPEIKNKFKKAGEQMPANPTRDLKVAIANGWIYESDDETGAYELTGTGDAAIDSCFSELSSVSKPRKKTKRSSGDKAVRKKGVREEVKNIPTPSKESYFSLEQKSDKVLWILNSAKIAGIDGLSSSEICYVAKEKMRDKMAITSIASLTNPSIRKDFIEKEESLGEFRLLQKGVDKVESLLRKD